MTPLFNPATHTYTDATGKPLLSVTTILKLAGLIDDRWFTEEACWRGSCVHAACEYDDKGTLDESSVDLGAWGYLVAWRKCKQALGIVGFTSIEKPMMCATLQFAGTPDRRGRRGSRRFVIDIKTGSHEPWHELQLAGYAEFDYCPEAVDRIVVRLKEDGSYSMKMCKDWHTDRAGFHGALAMAKWRQINNV